MAVAGSNDAGSNDAGSNDRERFGRGLLPAFALAPDVAHLNHGAYGAPPLAVLREAERIRAEVERDPTAFMERRYRPLLREAAARIGGLIGAAGPNIAMVENATLGVNAVLRNLDFAPGDEILLTDQTYGAVRNTVRYVAARSGATVVTVAVPFPAADPEAIRAAFAPHIGPRLKLAVIDHATSPTALVLPVADLVRMVRAGSDALILVDGAHAPGMLPIDVGAIGADWYTGNCHKWLFAAKGCAFLWASDGVREATHPLVISHGFEQGFEAEFDWVGTRDAAAQFALGTALDFRERFGDLAIRSHNHDLVTAGGDLLAQAWGTECGASHALCGAMQTVRLPDGFDPDPDAVLALRQALLDRFAVQVPIRLLAGALRARISAQIYNGIDDYERLAEAVLQLAAERRAGRRF
ncbi:MAG: aminotransferase class V-fold PLP-dependent enzyme [Sneathiellaceae bacterium]